MKKRAPVEMAELSEYFGGSDANALRRLRRWCSDTVQSKWRRASLRERMTLFVVAVFAHVLDSLVAEVAELDNVGPEPKAGVGGTSSAPAGGRTMYWGD